MGERNNIKTLVALWLGLFALITTTPVFPLTPRLLDHITPGVNVGTFTIVAAFTVLFAGIVAFIVSRKNNTASSCFNNRLLAVGTGVYFIVALAGFLLMPLMENSVIAVLFGILLGLGMSAQFML